MSDCVFCDIVAGTAPASIVYQDDIVVAFMDIRPLHITRTAIAGGATGAGVSRQGGQHTTLICSEACEPRDYPLRWSLTAGAWSRIRKLAYRANKLEFIITISTNILIYRHLLSPLPV